MATAAATTETKEIKVYGYRWVVLLTFMAIVGINQLLWITFASITSESARMSGVCCIPDAP